MPNEVLKVAGGFIDRAEWVFAKTMPHMPHEYAVRRICQERGIEEDFEQVVLLMSRGANTGGREPHNHTQIRRKTLGR